MESKQELEQIYETIRKYEKTMRDILEYEAYSWNNDRQFIESRINDVLKNK